MRDRRTRAKTSPTAAMIKTGPNPCHSRSTNAIGAAWSCSKPSQPCRARRWTRNASCSAWRRWTRTKGLDARKHAIIRPTPEASRRQAPHAATTSGTTRKTPGYLNPVARPAAAPASSIRPDTINASDAATPSASGMSVTASREYATCTVQTAAAAAATAPACGPYARRPSHHVAATDATANTIATMRAVRNDGSDCHA